MNDNQKSINEQQNKTKQNCCPIHHNPQTIRQESYSRSYNSNIYNTIQQVAKNQKSQILPTTIQSRRIIVNQQYIPVTNSNNLKNKEFFTNNEYNSYQKNQNYNQEYKQFYNNSYSYNNITIPQFKKIERIKIISEPDYTMRKNSNNYSFYVSKTTSGKSAKNIKQYKNNPINYNNSKLSRNYGINQTYQTSEIISNNSSNSNKIIRRYSYNYNKDTNYNNNYSENGNIYRNNRNNVYYKNNNFFERSNKPMINIINQKRVIQQPAYEQAKYIKKLIETEEQIPYYKKGNYTEIEPFNNKNYISERKNYNHKYRSKIPNNYKIKYSKNKKQNIKIEQSDIREYEGSEKYDKEQRININKINPKIYNNFNFNKRNSHSENKNNTLYKNDNNYNNYNNIEKENYYEFPSFRKRHTEIISSQSRYSSNNYKKSYNKYNVSTENPSLNSHYNSRKTDNQTPYKNGSRIIKNKHVNRRYTTFEKNLQNIRELDIRNDGIQISTTNSNNHSFYISEGFSNKQKKYKTSTMQQAYRANKYILKSEDGTNDNDNYDYYEEKIISKHKKLMSPKEDSFGFMSLEKEDIVNTKNKENEQQKKNKIKIQIKNCEGEKQKENININNKNFIQNNERYYTGKMNENININNNQYQNINSNLFQLNYQKNTEQYQKTKQESDRKNNHNYYESCQIKKPKKQSNSNYNNKIIINQKQSKIPPKFSYDFNENKNKEEDLQEQLNYEEKEQDLNPNDNINSEELTKPIIKFSSYFGDSNNNYYESGKINKIKLSQKKKINFKRYNNLHISNDGIFGIQSETLCVPAQEKNKKNKEKNGEKENQENKKYEKNENEDQNNENEDEERIIDNNEDNVEDENEKEGEEVYNEENKEGNENYDL